MREETIRSRQPTTARDPASSTTTLRGTDLEAMKRKFPFLLEYSDEFIRDTGVHILIKAETASRKLQDMDRSKKAEDKLFFNRESLCSTVSHIAAGTDNRLDLLHTARCLPGATCSAGKLWLHARSVMGDKGHSALSTYDMGSIGLGGCVSAKGWVEIHDPASASLSIRMFSMGSCVSRGVKSASDDDFPEMSDLSEFKAAIRVLWGAMAFVHPWNRSIDALENFLIQSNFGLSDLAGVSKPAAFLSQFTDYVLVENASRWKGDGDLPDYQGPEEHMGRLHQPEGWLPARQQKGKHHQQQQQDQLRQGDPPGLPAPAQLPAAGGPSGEPAPE